jgi:hypothetical protein
MLTKRELILAKIETSYGVDSTPAAATDAVLVEDLAWSHAGARLAERPGVRPNLGQLQQIFGGTLLQLTFACELKGPGAAFSATVRPEIDALLRACALGATIVTTVGLETASYAPVSSALESVTIYLYRDGKRFIVTGCRGTVELALETGNKGLARFTVTGHVAAEADVALATPTFDATKPPAVKGGTFTIGAYAAVVSALNVNLNNQVATPPSISAADGFAEIRITGRDVAGSFDPEDVLVATYPFIANWKAGATAAIATGVIGDTQYNRYQFDLPAVYHRELAPGDRDGIRTLETPFGAAESSGDDEVTLLFT